jgi:hypothetical protein
MKNPETWGLYLEGAKDTSKEKKSQAENISATWRKGLQKRRTVD